MAFQYPVEVPGVGNAVFLRAACNAIRRHRGQPELDPLDFDALLREKLDFLGMSEKFIERSVNVDFSGGEKKRNEILQMAILEPEIAILDETDSGLDIDALRVVARGVREVLASRPDLGILAITHYQRLLDELKPEFVHVLVEGRIVESGGPALALRLESEGYDAWR